MPTVGKKKFSYSASGQKKAKDYAKKTGKKVVKAPKPAKPKKTPK